MTLRRLLALLMLVGGAAFGAFADPVSDAGPASGLTGMAWLSPATDTARHFTIEPRECLAPARDDETAYLISVGRSAFRNPMVLGEQAARQGLSCNSCHRNGHDNPDFFIAGLSGRPGTVDVTSAVFSKSLEDGRENPVPIPSLLNSHHKSAFGSGAAGKTLDAFLAHVVETEFQGRPLSKTVHDGLKHYIRHLKSDACGPSPTVQVTETTRLEDVRRSVNAAIAAAERGDRASADLLILGAQVALGRLHERYPNPVHAPDRAAIQALARSLQTIRGQAAHDGMPEKDKLMAVIKDVERLAARLRPLRPASLFNPRHPAFGSD